MGNCNPNTDEWYLGVKIERSPFSGPACENGNINLKIDREYNFNVKIEGDFQAETDEYVLCVEGDGGSITDRDWLDTFKAAGQAGGWLSKLVFGVDANWGVKLNGANEVQTLYDIAFCAEADLFSGVVNYFNGQNSKKTLRFPGTSDQLRAANIDDMLARLDASQGTFTLFIIFDPDIASDERFAAFSVRPSGGGIPLVADLRINTGSLDQRVPDSVRIFTRDASDNRLRAEGQTDAREIGITCVTSDRATNTVQFFKDEVSIGPIYNEQASPAYASTGDTIALLTGTLNETYTVLLFDEVLSSSHITDVFSTLNGYYALY